MTVPMPTAPPNSQPQTRKQASTHIRTTENFFLSLSLITTPTRSFGPVPVSDFITIGHSTSKDNTTKGIAHHTHHHSALRSNETSKYHIEEINYRTSAEHADKRTYLFVALVNKQQHDDDEHADRHVCVAVS